MTFLWVSVGDTDASRLVLIRAAESSGSSSKSVPQFGPGTMPPKAKKARVEFASTLLNERVNVKLIEEVARSELGAWRPHGGPRLRTILADVLACCQEGELTSAWREEDMAVEFGVLGRRYSGPKAAADERFRKL